MKRTGRGIATDKYAFSRFELLMRLEYQYGPGELLPAAFPFIAGLLELEERLACRHGSTIKNFASNDVNNINAYELGLF